MSESFVGRLVLCALLLSGGCALAPEAPKDEARLTPVAFADLDGWTQDDPLPALRAFRKSCATTSAQKFRVACERSRSVAATAQAARQFFEAAFTPYALAGRAGDEGLFTGYYVPELRASLRRTAVYRTPLYGRPVDKIDVDPALFKASWKGGRLTGKVREGRLIPYDDRAAITSGSLEGRAPVVAWVDDPVDAFFLEIQGSGRLRFEDGTSWLVGYESANGRAYVPIGRVLAARGDLARPVTMPSLRAWLAANPDKARGVMNENPSYIFFRRLSGDAVLGAQGVGLTPERSLAVDPSFVPLGAPVWLETSDGGNRPLHRLMVAQDTGGAIKGVVRGDVFWGEGAQAAAQAGAMQSRGRAFLLLPQDPSADAP